MHSTLAALLVVMSVAVNLVTACPSGGLSCAMMHSSSHDCCGEQTEFSSADCCGNRAHGLRSTSSTEAREHRQPLPVLVVVPGWSGEAALLAASSGPMPRLGRTPRGGLAPPGPLLSQHTSLLL